MVLVLIVAALPLVFGCQREAGDTGTHTAVDTAGVVAPGETIDDPAAGAPLSAPESRYIHDALMQGMGHIELARSISGRNDSDAVGTLAAEVIRGHEETNADLALVTTSELPAEASPELRQTIARLEPFNGVNLDAAYLAAMLQHYPELIRLHQSAASTSTDTTVQKIAVRAQSRFEGHLEQVRTVYAQVTGVVPQPGPASGSPTPE